ncbi:MAG TPA: hypothetical protein PK562_03150, partial [Candidatus Omnitrophota bacterium]|nr:hypothetical protein [Candidatus Omnitrophota bacterium]
LNSTGFRQELGLGQSTGALLWMRIYDIGIPIITSLLALLVIWRFEISENKAYDVRAQIERRREERRKDDERRAEERRQEERRREERRGNEK